MGLPDFNLFFSAMPSNIVSDQPKRMRSLLRHRDAKHDRQLASAKPLATEFSGSKLEITILLALVGAFIFVLSTTRLATSIKIGADEHYELSKALLAAKGFQFYTEIWNDQPLLHTAIIAWLAERVTPSALGPRLLSATLAILLVFSVFAMARRISGPVCALLTAFLLFASPGFIDLSSSCMVEIPALSLAVAALSILTVLHRSKPKLAVVLCGILFGISLQVKLINVILAPIFMLIIFLGQSCRAETAPPGRVRIRVDRALIRGSIIDWVLGIAVSLFTFLAINWLLPHGSYLLQLKQTWFAHFAYAQSFEYGSPSDYRFDWSVLVKNWDQTIPATFGILVCVLKVSTNRWFAVPAAWFFLELIIFAVHTPWWSYYYVHNAVPIAWCAAIGIGEALHRCGPRRKLVPFVVLSVFLTAATAWLITRVYLQTSSIRKSPQTYNSLILQEIERYKPHTQFFFSEEAVYTFHSGIPLPPKLGIVSLKRFWSGDLTNARLSAELSSIKPGLIMTVNDSRARPYTELLQSDYALVFEDQKHRLYARRDVARQAKW